jgi:DNA-binding NarL/FixJ family response regulator
VKVILVDDDTRFLTALEALIDTLPGIEVIARASDGPAAIDLAGQLEPDVVVMDLDMPLMDGVTATRHLLEAAPDVKVVILSGSDVIAHWHETMRAGASAYVRKSRTVEDLPRVLAELDARQEVSPEEV